MLQHRAVNLDAQTIRRRTRDHRGHHPWQHLGEHLTQWKVEFTSSLPDGVWGRTLHAENRILLAEGMTTAERRSTLCHEVGHVLRGPSSVCVRLREESLVDRQAARLLLPNVRRIGHALAWSRADHVEAAKSLWVDEQLLHVRLSTLAPRDRAYLHDQLTTILIDR